MITIAMLVMLSQTAGDVKKETGEAVDATKKYANEKKEEFEARIELKLKAIKDDLHKVKEKTKDKADKTVSDLEAKEKKAEAKIGEVKKASGNAWSKLKEGVEGAVDELDKGVKEAKAK